MRLLRALSALGALICFTLWADRAIATRNASGTYSLASGNPVVTGSTISSTWANNTLSDLATALTDSLDRNGKGGMLAALRGIDGTVAAPAFSFTSDTDSGFYRIGADNIGLALGGTKIVDYTSNGIRSANGAVATPSLSFFNDTGSGLYRIGANDIGFAINGVKVSEWNASGFGVGAAAPHSTAPLFAIGAGSSLAAVSRSGVNTRIYSNAYFNGTNDVYNANGFAGILQLGGATSADFSFLTAPSGTAGNSITSTTRVKINESGLTVGAAGDAFIVMNHGTCSVSGGVCATTVSSAATACFCQSRAAAVAGLCAVTGTSASCTIGAGNGTTADVFAY